MGSPGVSPRRRRETSRERLEGKLGGARRRGSGSSGDAGRRPACPGRALDSLDESASRPPPTSPGVGRRPRARAGHAAARDQRRVGRGHPAGDLARRRRPLLGRRAPRRTPRLRPRRRPGACAPGSSPDTAGGMPRRSRRARAPGRVCSRAPSGSSSGSSTTSSTSFSSSRSSPRSPDEHGASSSSRPDVYLGPLDAEPRSRPAGRSAAGSRRPRDARRGRRGARSTDGPPRRRRPGAPVPRRRAAPLRRGTGAAARTKHQLLTLLGGRPRRHRSSSSSRTSSSRRRRSSATHGASSSSGSSRRTASCAGHSRPRLRSATSGHSPPRPVELTPEGRQLV